MIDCNLDLVTYNLVYINYIYCFSSLDFSNNAMVFWPIKQIGFPNTMFSHFPLKVGFVPNNLIKKCNPFQSISCYTKLIFLFSGAIIFKLISLELLNNQLKLSMWKTIRVARVKDYRKVASINMSSRVANVVAIHNDLLTQWRPIYMSKFRTNIYYL